MKISQRFNTFCDNIRLTPNQYGDAKTKYDNVCRVLHNHYYPDSTYSGSTKFLIGSYGKETAIRPPGDVDVIFKIPWAVYSRFKGNKTGPRGLLNEIKTVLSKTFTTTEKIRPNGMVVEVAFTTFNIEILPAYEWSIDSMKGQFTVPDTGKGATLLPSLFDFGTSTNYGRWKEIDPRKEIQDLSASNTAYNGNTKNLIRMMKRWKGYCSVPIKGVVIERLVREFMWTFTHSSSSAVYYDYMVRDFLAYLRNHKNSTIFMPGINENIQIGEDWYSKADTAYSRALTACEYEAASKDFDAAYEWKKIFGGDYPY